MDAQPINNRWKRGKMRKKGEIMLAHRLDYVMTCSFNVVMNWKKPAAKGLRNHLRRSSAGNRFSDYKAPIIYIYIYYIIQTTPN